MINSGNEFDDIKIIHGYNIGDVPIQNDWLLW